MRVRPIAFMACQSRTVRLCLLLLGPLFFVAAACSQAQPSSESQVQHPELRQEILRMVEVDQAVQQSMMEKAQAGHPLTAADEARRDSVFAANLRRMRQILDTYGWPGIALVGEDGSHGAWILIQHADQDTTLQRTALGLLELTVASGDASGRDLAYLTDRMRVAEGKPQVYGTQLQYDDRGCASPEPTEEGVDARRASVGLPPIATYLSEVMEMLGRAEACQGSVSARWSEMSTETAGVLNPIPQDSLAGLRYQHFFDDTATLNYARLLAYRALEDRIPSGLKRRAYYNVLALLEAYVGNVYEAIELTDRGALEPTTMMVFDSTGAMTEVPFYPEAAYAEYPDSLMQAHYDATDFAELLRSIPDDVRVFALNEAHTAPLFRATLYNALPELRRQGFTHLAHETLYAEREDFNASSFPARTSGFFSGEVVSGDVFRRAKALGFTLVSYDAQNAGSQQAREEQSYQTLMDRTFREDPDARVILYAGHSHTWTTTIGPIRMLGQQLVDDGIDPLVIHQSRYYERNVPPSLTRPTLFQPKDPTTRTEGAYDYVLVLPKSHPVHGRPSWLWAMDRQPVALPPTVLRELATPFLVEAFIADEPETAVPLDRLEVTDVHAAPHLALRPGAYRVRITTPTNAVHELALTVE